jgi:cytochrome c biogenesis protein CcmG/thiol:disulfide interchange protein DsbE
METRRSQIGRQSRQSTLVVLMLAVVVAVIAAAGGLGLHRPILQGAVAASPPAEGPAVGRPAPAFAVPAIAGGQVSLAQYAGQPRVLSFFASSCLDCRPDLAALEGLYRRYQGHGLVVLGVAVGTTAGDARWFAKQVGATFPIGYDETGDRTVRAYQLYAVPTTVFVKPDGTIAGILQGRVTDKVLAPYLARILPAATQ